MNQELRAKDANTSFVTMPGIKASLVSPSMPSKGRECHLGVNYERVILYVADTSLSVDASPSATTIILHR
jgi:hypothetical protein